MSEVAVTDKREKMANQLLMRGYASMRELLEMSFGEWPMKGLGDLDTTYENEKVILAYDVFEDASCSGATGPAWESLPFETAFAYRAIGIRINEKFNDKKWLNEHAAYLPSTVGHETIHVLQRAQSLNDIFNNQNNEKFLADFVPRGESIVKSINKEEFLQRSNITDPIEQRYISYLLRGNEIQARLHQFLMEGYQTWRSLPVNGIEISTAFILNLSPPDSALIAERAKATGKVRENFLKVVPIIDYNAAVNDFCDIVSGLSNEEAKVFINDIIPALYVNLLELYGDKNARQRFGLDENYRPIKQELKQTAPVVATPSPA